MICPLCNSENKSLRSLTAHMRCYHKLAMDIYKDILFNHNPELFISCIECNIKIKKFPNAGGAETCSLECRKLARHKINLNRKQSESHIQKRISNTDQIAKETTRQNTMTEKYGSLVHIPNTEERSAKISNALKGKIRTTEHTKKIIESKRKNGTLRHSISSKSKIKDMLLKYYQEGDDQNINIPKNIIKSNGRGHKTGIFNDIHYRSSYELLFLRFCERNEINVKSAESKQFRIRYTIDGKKHWYYPDFYLPDFDIIIEIKPASRIKENKDKFAEANKEVQFLVLTEEDLLGDDIMYFKILNTYLGSI